MAATLPGTLRHEPLRALSALTRAIPSPADRGPAARPRHGPPGRSLCREVR